MGHLVLIETAGNQRYVFGTNRMRENVGASELLYRIGTSFVVRAVERNGGKSYECFAEMIDRREHDGESYSTREFITALNDIAKSNPLEADGVEIVVATSGKALLLVKDKGVGKGIVAAVTARALKEAPGAIVRGFIDIEINLTGGVKTAHEAVTRVHRGIERLRLDLPPPEARFPTLPILRPCRSSGLPATGFRGDEADYPIAEPVCLKEKARESGMKRMRTALGMIGERLHRRIDRFEKDIDWLGIVHADGNGFGRLFMGFDKVFCAANERGAKTGRDYFDAYRTFSVLLELCGLAAFEAALRKLAKTFDAERGAKKDGTPYELPVVPLVLGGDDLTVAMDGKYAIDFAADYLRAFEEATEKDEFKSSIPGFFEKDGNLLGAAAGVAIVKPHFPFHRAYELAEDLLKSAKQSKRLLGFDDENGKFLACDAVSALDFQAIYEDAAADVDELRERWKIERDGNPPKETRLWTRPYIVSTGKRLDDALAKAGDKARIWAGNRAFDKFHEACKAIGAGEDGERAGLPRTQQHALRKALFCGRESAEARLELIKHRYAERGVDWAEVNGNCEFFFEDPVPDSNNQWRDDIHATLFLDALEYRDIARPKSGAGETAPDEDKASATELDGTAS